MKEDRLYEESIYKIFKEVKEGLEEYFYLKQGIVSREVAMWRSRYLNSLNIQEGSVPHTAFLYTPSEMIVYTSPEYQIKAILDANK